MTLLTSLSYRRGDPIEVQTTTVLSNILASSIVVVMNYEIVRIVLFERALWPGIILTLLLVCTGNLNLVMFIEKPLQKSNFKTFLWTTRKRHRCYILTSVEHQGLCMNLSLKNAVICGERFQLFIFIMIMKCCILVCITDTSIRLFLSYIQFLTVNIHY